MYIKSLPPAVNAFDAERLQTIADHAGATLSSLRDALLDPWPRKVAPIITGTRLTKLLGVTPERFQYLVRNLKIPPGTSKGNGRHREYTLADAQEIVRVHGPHPKRPAGAPGIVLSVGNFKGGVGKTTMAVALAQGLTLHGHKVALFDLDPQGSSTTVMGYVPDAEVDDSMTVMPLVFGEQPDLAYALQPSYWPNLDFIPASPALFGADFFLPNKQASEPGFEFWNILEAVMAPLREKYDVIVIDTPPTLSYLAIASFMATDGMIVPVPPETLDYASSTQFFRQFAELFRTMQGHRGVAKQFAFVRLVLSKVKETAATTAIVRGWIKSSYPELMAGSEILESDVVKNASAQFRTVYDISTYEGSLRTFNRALEAFDAVVAEIESELAQVWAATAAQEAA